MLYRITLHLARGREFPAGSSRHGYELVVPLDAEGRLDPEEWKEKRAQCRVRRFWAGEPDRRGRLLHRAGGSGGATWLVDYNQDTVEDDEAGFHLQTHVFAPNEYVSFRDEDGDYHTFQVVDRQPLGAASGRPFDGRGRSFGSAGGL